MAIFKCKMCGGDLNIIADEKIVECEFCGTTQTIPDGSDEKKTNLFNRANRLRMDNEFDKAAGVYESIVSEFPEEAEGYWGLVLCSYGIEYVDDPKTGKKIPTCHRTLTSSVMDDDNFVQACENADVVARGVYREEAKAIDKLQQQIIAVVENEEPYDVFICYKETDDITKQRTEDSLIAQDIYTELIKEGYKVFFSRVTLRDKAGTEYEPYIYAALKSAKIMLAIGTKFDYYDAVWVKNEWSRYISMMADDSSKHLIPCFKNLDAYDIPKEFKNLQALDMGEVTFFKNLTDNVERFIPREAKEHIVVENTVSSTGALTKRGYIYLEDKDFVKADEYFDKALDEAPEDSKAYLGKFLAALQISAIEETDNCLIKIDTFKDFERALRFANSKEKALLEKVKEKSEKKYLLACFVSGLKQHIKKQEIAEITYCDANKLMQKNTADNYNLAIDMFEKIKGYKDSEKLKELCNIKIKEIQTENELERKTELYNEALSEMKAAGTESGFKNVAKKFEEIKGFQNADELINECLEKAEFARIDAIYASAISLSSNSVIPDIEKAITIFKTIPGHRDSEEKIIFCENKIAEINKADEERRIERERQEQLKKEQAEKAAKFNKKIGIIAIATICVFIVTMIIINTINKNAFAKKYGEKAISKYGVEFLSQLDKLEPGDYLELGTYEQDNNTSNGAEPIEWLVLDRQDKKILVTSKYVLDNYEISNIQSSWRDSNIRTWLNYTFLYSAFSESERDLIGQTLLSDPGANGTLDSVFLLTDEEAFNCFIKSQISKTCEATSYAHAQNVPVTDGCAHWWVRNGKTIPTTNSGIESYTEPEFYYISDGLSLHSMFSEKYSEGLRPAMWIDLSTL